LNLSSIYYIIIHIKKEIAMITLQQFLDKINYKITGGSTFLWSCYGEDVYSIDSWVEGHYEASVTFNPTTQEAFEITVFDEVNERQYRWINPLVLDAYNAEFLERGLDKQDFGFKYTNIEVDFDMLEKLEGIVNKTEYDTRVVIQVDMSDTDFLTFAKAAHAMDVSFNEFVEKAIKSVIETRDPEWV